MRESSNPYEQAQRQRDVRMRNDAREAAPIDYIIEKYLCYQDVPLDPEAKSSALRESLADKKVQAYAKALQDLIVEQSEHWVNDFAENMKFNTDTILKELEIDPTVYGKSISWAMWDIAKQEYLAQHPEESGDGYLVAHPLVSLEKRQEMVDRHVGFEAYAAFCEERFDLQNVAKGARIEDIEDSLGKYLYNAERKESGQLSSKSYAELGKAIREIQMMN